MSTKTLLLSLVTFAFGEDYIPDCNYAAVGSFYYPIDACESDINITESTTYSFKYICNANDTIEKYMYSTFDCNGTPNETITNMTELAIEHYSCSNALSCDYAVVCSFLECNFYANDTECDLCSDESYSQLLTENHDTHCRPFIKDQCIGSSLSFALTYQCEGGVLSTYYKGNCTDTGFEIDSFGAEDTTCRDDNFDDEYAYYTVDCDPFVVEPDCNYVGTAAHSYPVGACESDINVTSGELYSFKYICDGNMIIKEYYDTFGCEGDVTMSKTDLTGEVENYQCRSPNGNCAYAMACSYQNCGNVNDTTCSQCSDPDYDDSLQQNHNTQCRPYITGECFGDATFGLFKKSTCSGGVLSEGFYGDGCTDDVFYFADTLGGDGMCQDLNFDDIYTYYEVDCNPDIVEPECNFAATGTHNYPIGACETDVNATTGEMVSFKYVCNDNYEVEMEVYQTFDCYGTPNETLDQSVLELEDYQCRSKYGECSYSIGCAFSNCGDDSGCNNCTGLSIQSLIQTQDTHCFPYITNQCFGVPGFLQENMCINNQLSESFYFGSECIIDYYGFNDTFGGDSDTCKDPNYDGIYTLYDIDCTPNVLTPECNFVAAKGHFYPIGACETDTNSTSQTIESFKYACNGNNEIEKYIYSTFDCYGFPEDVISGTDLTELEYYTCGSDNGDCPYAVSCSYIGCNDECDDCSGLTELELISNYDTHCRGYIIDQCLGNEGGLLQQSTCSNDLLTENLYFGTECTDLNLVLPFSYGGDGNYSCQDNNFDGEYTYYTTECEPTLIQPECNYAATSTHFYPINACESYNIIINDTQLAISSNYACDDNNEIIQYFYDGLNCESDGMINSTMPTDILHYQCQESRDCNYVIGCAYSDCAQNSNDTQCSICSAPDYINNNGQNHNIHCFPQITDECFGNKDELLHSSTCANNELIESFYFGRECTVNTYLFGDTFGTENTTCKDGTYYDIQCVLTFNPTKEPTSDPTSLPTSDPTSDPTEVPTQEPTTAAPTTEPTAEPTAEPTMEPTQNPIVQDDELSTDPTTVPTQDPTFDESGANIISICIAFIFVNVILLISF